MAVLRLHVRELLFLIIPQRHVLAVLTQEILRKDRNLSAAAGSVDVAAAGRGRRRQCRAFDGAEAILASAMRKARFWESVAEQPLNERQRKVERLVTSWFQPGLMKSMNCSSNTGRFP